MPEIVTPTLASAPDGPAQLALLATRVVDVLTRAERVALAGADLWDGRVVYDTDWDQWMGYSAGRTRWEFIGNELLVSSGTTAALGAAPTLLNTTDIYPGVRVVYRNTADPVEIKNYDVIDTSPVTYLESPWNAAWGYVDRQLATAASTGTTTTTGILIPGCTKSVALRKNRRYRVDAVALLTDTVALEYGQIIMRVNAASVLGAVNIITNTGSATRINLSDTFDFVTASGNYTCELWFGRNFGSGTIGHRSDIDQARFVISDVGPAGIPSA